MSPSGQPAGHLMNLAGEKAMPYCVTRSNKLSISYHQREPQWDLNFMEGAMSIDAIEALSHPVSPPAEPARSARSAAAVLPLSASGLWPVGSMADATGEEAGEAYAKTAYATQRGLAERKSQKTLRCTAMVYTVPSNFPLCCSQRGET